MPKPLRPARDAIFAPFFAGSDFVNVFIDAARALVEASDVQTEAIEELTKALQSK
jgi:hypothetical protein